MKTKLLTYFFATVFSASAIAQEKETGYLDKSWKQVATGMPDSWYGSEAAKNVAENVLLYQKAIGGWEKNKDFHHPVSDAERNEILAASDGLGATFDNGATIQELRFLANMAKHANNPAYAEAFKKGLDYTLEAQYANGGWPQFYPARSGGASYSEYITYNDDAMVNILRFLKEVYAGSGAFAASELDTETKGKAKAAFDKGIKCILATQIVVDGKPTVWCAQHDQNTLAPAKARAFELASYSGAESVGIVLLLMRVDQPSDQVIAAVEGAMDWFDSHRVEGLRLDTELDAEGRKNRIVVPDPTAPTLWARFYDLETGQPFFCDRDGVKKQTLAEIGYERRNGYSWYTSSPAKLFKEYPEWKKRVGLE
ncbi:pectate lyase [Algoriphagus sp. H41]|uniref:Pectate lyase n=1 Tax=Algoriphagus oliviformis TaxID=2811231 RepID=A0ABS3C0S3_9BACT|nr:pectate lyase [Algoriphagus oliviformis]MBN7810717.1 pectate lyase [Algoriphagus oliviformis]